jgi:DNA ligase (NAD+)
MEKDRLSEDRYLKAKIAYYEGNPTMSDAEFDVLEQYLRNLGSKVIEQVGSKRKDFDFEHPTKMLSLGKIQTEALEDGTTNYVEDLFLKWFNKQAKIVGKMAMLEASPKFDGNAINIIYQGRKLVNVLTRGDGLTGKDVTKRFTNYLPHNIVLVDLEISEDDVLEIRAEVVIDINLFNSKYAVDFANARNYVAGVIGKDDYDEVKVSELKIISLHYLVNGKHVSKHHFRHNKFFEDWDTFFVFEDYEKIIKEHEELRKTVGYQLDGVVISFPVQERETLGENDHDPEWALAVKFVPAETITEVEGIEWNISKRGEMIPTLLLKAVFLDGSTVSRCSAYNAGYVIKNGLKSGSIVSIAKHGDIIPAVQKVIKS